MNTGRTASSSSAAASPSGPTSCAYFGGWINEPEPDAPADGRPDPADDDDGGGQ